MNGHLPLADSILPLEYADQWCATSSTDALEGVDALENAELAHEAPALVRCQTSSAIAHAAKDELRYAAVPSPGAMRAYAAIRPLGNTLREAPRRLS